MLKRFTPILVLTTVCWVVFLVNNALWGGSLNRYGIVPRQVASLPGVVLAPFLHGSYRHLAANTLPLLVLGAIVCARGKGNFAVVTVGGVLLGGGLTWLVARSAYHVGASGLIFCYFGYLASRAWFDRTLGALVLSVICLVAYGGLLRGIVPTSSGVSWEGHLAGLVAGVVLAWFMAKLRRLPLEVGPAVPGARSQD